MTTKLPKTCTATLFIALFVGVLIAGCITPPEMTNNLSNATTVSQQNDDFPVLISKDGWYGISGTGTIVKNFSEIVANNYTDIPNFLALYDGYFCGYTPESNYSKVADVALHDPRIQKVLRDKGVVQGLFFGPAYSTHSKDEDPCKTMYISLEFIYRGQHEMALINETTGEVYLNHILEQNLTERLG